MSDLISRRIAELEGGWEALERAETDVHAAAADALDARDSLKKLGPLGEVVAGHEEGFDATTDVVLAHKRRFLEIYEEISDLRAQTTRSLADAHRGTFETGQTYRRGDLLTHSGGLWLALADGTDKPGTSEQWRLIVKAGRDGRR